MLKMQNIAIILDNQGIQYQSKLTDKMIQDTSQLRPERRRKPN